MALNSDITGSSRHGKFVLKLSDFKLTGLAKTRSRGIRQAKYYLRLSVANTEHEHKTGTAANKDGAFVWSDNVFFHVSGSQVLCIHLYLQRSRPDSLLTEVEANIKEILDEGVLNRLLNVGTHANKENAVLCKFSMSVSTDTSGASALDLQMIQAVNQTHEPIDQMRSLSNSFRAACEAEPRIVQAADVFTDLLGKVEKFDRIIKDIAEVHPYATMAWKILSAAHSAILTQQGRDERVLNLLETMNSVYTLILEAEPLKKIQTQQEALEMLAKQTTECAYFISDYAHRPDFWARLAKNITGSVDNKITHFEESFRSLKATFHDGVVLNTELFVSRMISDIETMAAEASLNDMPYARGAGYIPENGCLPYTREEIIQEIIDWVNLPDSPDVQRILWLSGMAGTGKSAIAHTLARRFDEIKRLGSSFFFDASMQDERRITHLFSTIAINLADLDPEWKKSLWNAVKDQKALRTTNSVELQFKHFILEPAKSLKTIGPTLLLVDAVDESGGRRARAKLLQILANASTLPLNFRILITSRPDDDIEEHLGSNPYILRKRMEEVQCTARDIRRYIQEELSCFSKLDSKWPNGEWLDRLVDMSEGLFQWAFTTCRFIDGDGKCGLDPVERLAILLSPESCDTSHPLNALDKLYLKVLRQTFSAQVLGRFRSVMSCVLAARQPLSMTALKKLTTEVDNKAFEHPVDLILRPLGSLLSGVSQTLSPVLPLHTSFRDFLLDPKRSFEFYVDISQEDDRFTVTCFSAMQAGLQFNICDLETSYLDNHQIPDLSSRIERAIPDHLSYACRFWADHLCASSTTAIMLGRLDLFMKTHLLHWIEAMSLMGVIDTAHTALQRLEAISEEMDLDLAALVVDANRFVGAFSAPISRSAAHTYLSALPFAPAESHVSKQYIQRFDNILSIPKGQMNTWPAILHVIEGHDGPIASVAFTPDGKQLASISNDGTIGIWNTQTSALVAWPFENPEPVRSVAFSRDCKRVASGCYDKMIRIWDAEKGALVAGPCASQGGFVTSIAFSYNGKLLASGSSDGKIQIWDTQTSVLAAGPFEYHYDEVKSITFSNDSKMLASGSRDTMIRIWNIQTGILTSARHDGEVNSVAFSSDGKLVASGSNDKTVRIWDVPTGNLVAGPFTGHCDWVNSVAFSNDAKRVVSGSDDKTVRIWDIQTGALIAGPLTGHDGHVRSVAFSIDGKRVASGARDGTIRIWDVPTGASITKPFEGHNDGIHAVAISPSMKQIVSGSRDSTLRIWNAQTGRLVAGPLQGHGNSVRSVAFSNNGQWFASGSDDNMIRIWDAKKGVIKGGPLIGHNSSITCVVFSHDGNQIASGSVDKTIRIWDPWKTICIVGPLTGHTSTILSLSFSYDGKWVVSGSDDQTVRVWDAKTGALAEGPFKWHSAPVSSVAFSNGSKQVVSVSTDMSIRIWDWQNSMLVAGPIDGHASALAISGDCKYTSSSSDCSIQIWDATKGVLVAGPFNGHKSWVNSLIFSHDNTRVVSCSEDRTCRVWAVPRNHVPAATHHIFKDETKLQDGWVLGEQGELILWVPPLHRAALYRPSNLLVIGQNATKLDLSKFVHGTRWMECKASDENISHLQ